MGEGYGVEMFTRAFVQLLDRGDAWLHRNVQSLFGDVPVIGTILGHCQISSRGLLLALAALLALCIVPPCTEWLLSRFRCTASNFRGDQIPQCYGLVILISAEFVLMLDAWVYTDASHERLLWLACIAAFGALGFLDDILGDKRVKGLRGHARALIHERRLTTGLIKAIGGGMAALFIGYHLYGPRPWLVLLSAAVIALSANAMNLLDLRPGRACGIFCLAAILLMVVDWRRDSRLLLPELLYITLPALIVWTHDGDARVMLGDTGSNLLGAALGLAVCVTFGAAVQAVLLAALIGLHLAAERVSLTTVIEGNTILRAIDRLTGVRASNDTSRSAT